MHGDTFMYDLASMLAVGFVIGLTGALAPGPTLVATIQASLKGDWTTGLKISCGHMVVEAVIVLLIVLGLAAVAQPYTALIAVIGGSALIVFGVLTLRGFRDASLTVVSQEASKTPATSPYMAGLLTSAANPYFWIWWLSVGSTMVIAGLEGGLILAGAFMIGHWAADTGWYTLVSTGIARGKTIISDRIYRMVMAACGVFLILFGLYYLAGVLFR